MNESEHMLLIHQYKPHTFIDVTERCSDTVDILRNYISMDNMRIVLVGREGSGKTVWLDIIVNEYYSTFSKEEYKANVLRIHSLYEQGVGYFRQDVRHFCQTCSTMPNKKKILVIDDIDILPEMSQHILSSIIDKYKHKIHFISTCTNIYQLISNIQTRLFQVNMPEISYLYLRRLADKIINDHGILIDDDAIDHFIINSNNRINKLVHYFEKAILYNQPINILTGKNICSHMNIQLFEPYLQYIHENNLSMAINQLYDIYDKGMSVIDILDAFFSYIKTCSIISETNKYEIIELICKYIHIFYTIHEDQIELALLTNEIIQRIHKTSK